MNHTHQPVWRSAIAKKFVVALTGLFLCSFLMIHVIGSTLILAGPEIFNAYSHFLAKSKALIVIELALLGGFLLHVFIAGGLAALNGRARNRGYAVGAGKAKRTDFSSRSMIWQGLLILIFVIFHLATLKFGRHYTIEYDGVVMRDLYRLTIETFRNPWIAAFYCLTMITLGVHLNHGVATFMQSLGLCRAFHPVMQRLAIGFSLVISGCFLCEPIYAYAFLR